jgi:predicted homoserine dehydrogenase-like protein
MLNGGIVDYALGAAPHTGAFVVVHEEHPIKRRELAFCKMGDGPFYVFYTPFHLPHVQLGSTIARAALWNDPTVAPIGPPVCEVLAMAKKKLHSGELLDGVGGFTTYGAIENSATCYQENLLPMGLSEGCRLIRAIEKDEPVPYDSVEIPEGRLIDELWSEQKGMF